MGIMRHFEVVGRAKGASIDAPVQRLKLFAENALFAKSQYWNVVSKLMKIKKATGEIISVKDITAKDDGKPRYFGIQYIYKSRTNVNNAYKEVVASTNAEAVSKLLIDMAGRHRVFAGNVRVRGVKELSKDDLKSEHVVELADNDFAVPLFHVTPHMMNKSFKNRISHSRVRTVLSK